MDEASCDVFENRRCVFLLLEIIVENFFISNIFFCDGTEFTDVRIWYRTIIALSLMLCTTKLQEEISLIVTILMSDVPVIDG